MELGRIGIVSYYVVDLDNPSMVIDARSCIAEDIMNAVKYNELDSYIKEIKDTNMEPISEEDIPEFLKEADIEEN